LFVEAPLKAIFIFNIGTTSQRPTALVGGQFSANGLMLLTKIAFTYIRRILALADY
jgi:hypothetical protein